MRGCKIDSLLFGLALSEVLHLISEPLSDRPVHTLAEDRDGLVQHAWHVRTRTRESWGMDSLKDYRPSVSKCVVSKARMILI